MEEELSPQVRSVLEPFQGRWSLDLKRSDPITPMLAAIGTPYLVRKLAETVQVEQVIRVDGIKFEINNNTSYGSTTVIHLINRGEIELVDDKGDKTLDTTTIDETAAYPFVIQASLPNGKGFTRDSRRILGDEMEQILEHRSREGDKAIVMKRLWNRIGSIESSVPIKSKEANRIEASLLPVPKESQVVPQASTSSMVRTDLRNVQPTVASVAQSSSEDWPVIAFLLVFTTSCLWREYYVQAFVWSALLLLVRTKVLFPPAKQIFQEVNWWSRPDAPFCATTLTMVFATQVLSSSTPDTLTAGLESLAVVAAYFYTRKADLMRLNLFTVFTKDAKTSPGRAWAEMTVVGIVVSAIFAESDTLAFNLSTFLLAICLYGLARYRAQMIMDNEAINNAIQPTAGEPLVTNSETFRERSAMMKRSRLIAEGNGPKVHFLGSRVTQYSGSPFAQYLAEISLPQGGSFSVWCRYRDLRACRDAIAGMYAVRQWGKPPKFPPKRWDSISNAAVGQRQTLLDDFFSDVFNKHGEEVAKLDVVERIFNLDENRANKLLELHDATRRLFRAKVVCERALAEGEDPISGWLLNDTARREYVKLPTSKDARHLSFKRIMITLTPVADAMRLIFQSSRKVWDHSFLSETVVKRLSLSVDDEQRAFADMTLHADQPFVLVKQIIRSNGSFFSLQPTSCLVYQALVRDPMTGRMAWLETSVSDPSMYGFDSDDKQWIQTVDANCFYVSPFATNRTKIMAYRGEGSAMRGFVIPNV